MENSQTVLWQRCKIHRDLQNANRVLLVGNPNLIYPGQVWPFRQHKKGVLFNVRWTTGWEWIRNKSISTCCSGRYWMVNRKKNTPGKLVFKVLYDNILDFQKVVRSGWRWTVTMYSLVLYSSSKVSDKIITVTAYDQLRYLKIRDTKVYENKTASQFVKMIADDYALNLGTLDDTGYVIESRIEENSELFEMITNALDLTLLTPGKCMCYMTILENLPWKACHLCMWVFRGAYLMIDEETGQDFEYTSSIDSNILITKSSWPMTMKILKKRDVYITQDSSNINKWGILQYFDTLQKGENGQAKADALLKLYNKKTRNLKITKCFGRQQRCGVQWLSLTLTSVIRKVRNWMLVEKCKHTYKEGEHWMDLTLEGWEFIAWCKRNYQEKYIKQRLKR